MNRIYRSIWNDKSGTFVAASENAHSGSRKSAPGASAAAGGARFVLKGLTLSLMLAFGPNIYALPTGGAVSAGSASIASGAGQTSIKQSSQNAAINWQSFSIGQGEAVRFVQPNSNSVALNRVLGSDPSNILGSLSANGKVFLVNPSGILFGQGAQVNVGGLLASTRGITDSDFMAGRYNFAGAGNGAVLNQGTIKADGGYVALLGANVSNEGVISAKLGTVVLAAGNAMTLDVAGDGLLNVAVNQGAVNALAQNGGLIQADGGQVLLTAQSAGNLLQSAVNNTGVIQAQSIENHNGSIRLMGDMQSGTVNLGGRLDASAPNGGNGGFIETSAAHVNVQDNARVTTAAPLGLTGTWLIDPVDFTVGSAPGDNITGATLSGSLLDTDITITTVAGPGVGNGDININEAITWNGSLGASLVPTTLTLNALRNVNIDAAITPTKGNLVVCCGQDINVREAITSVNGSILLSAGQDVNIVRSLANPATTITTTDGNIEICAGRNVNLDNTLNAAALMTLTRGSVVGGENLATLGVKPGLTLSAGTASTGPGAAGGTVIIGAGTLITVTGPAGVSPINISYNPASYVAGGQTDYSGFFGTSDGAPYAQFMLVFPDGANKIYDGTTAATFTGLKSSPVGVTLAGAGTATFDTKDVGNNKTITFSGFTLAQGATQTGGTGINFALPVSCCAPIASRTSANITPAPLTLKANNNTKVYGQTFTPLSTDFTIVVAPVAGETVTDVAETSTGSAATASVAGSTYPILITPGSASGSFTPSNYTVTLLPGALTVTPALLTITADDATKVYGQTFTPASTAFTTTALQNGETVASVTETSPAGTPATAAVPGPYAITPSDAAANGTFLPTNYSIAYVDGALLVTAVPIAGTPVETTPIATTPIETTPIATTPIETTPIETTPIATTPIETTPIETTPIEGSTTVYSSGDTPQLEQAPETLPALDRLNLSVVDTGVRTPPPLFAYLPAASPLSGFVDEKTPVETPQVPPPPVVAPPVAPPQIYAPPLRPRKPDRG